MYERFTDRARKVMQLANQEAQRFNHEYVGTEHVLLGLIKESSGVAANILKSLELTHDKIREEVEKIIILGPDIVTMGKLPMTPRCKKVVEFAMEEARNLQHSYVGTEHLLLGLLRETDGVASQVLMNLGATLEAVRELALSMLSVAPPTESIADPLPALTVAMISPILEAIAAGNWVRVIDRAIQTQPPDWQVTLELSPVSEVTTTETK